MSAHRDRGVLLMQQGRHEQAVTAFQEALRDDPADPASQGLLALCLSELGKLDLAEQAAGDAIRNGPDRGIGHYALAAVLLERNRLPEARSAVLEAIRIDPNDVHNQALLARVCFAERRWDDALAAADAGLSIDPESVACLNLRSLALQQLGRLEDAREVVTGALARNPESGPTHANAGWAALRAGEHKTALGHFKEALRLDPTLDHARAGIVEAMKARNPVYAVLLRYFFWMGRRSRKAQWLTIAAGYVVFRVLQSVAKANPGLAPLVWPLIAIYLVFVFLTWTGDPLFSLLLRLSPYGRLALTRDETVASNVTGIILLAALASGVWWIGSGNASAGVVMIGCLFLCIPASSVFSCEPGWPRRIAACYTAVLAAVGVAVVAIVLSSPPGKEPAAVLGFLALIFGIGVLLAPWIANLLLGIRPRR